MQWDPSRTSWRIPDNTHSTGPHDSPYGVQTQHRPSRHTPDRSLRRPQAAPTTPPDQPAANPQPHQLNQYPHRYFRYQTLPPPTTTATFPQPRPYWTSSTLQILKHRLPAAGVPPNQYKRNRPTAPD